MATQITHKLKGFKHPIQKIDVVARKGVEVRDAEEQAEVGRETIREARRRNRPGKNQRKQRVKKITLSYVCLLNFYSVIRLSEQPVNQTFKY